MWGQTKKTSPKSFENQCDAAVEIILSRLKRSNVNGTSIEGYTYRRLSKTGGNVGTRALGSGDYFEGDDVDLEE